MAGNADLGGALVLFNNFFDPDFKLDLLRGRFEVLALLVGPFFAALPRLVLLDFLKISARLICTALFSCEFRQ